MNKDEMDRRRWDAEPPDLLDWRRVPIPTGQNEWDVLGDEFADRSEQPYLVEWRPSTMGGYGAAAVWVQR